MPSTQNTVNNHEYRSVRAHQRTAARQLHPFSPSAMANS
jgi:hypothetical protein